MFYVHISFFTLVNSFFFPHPPYLAGNFMQNRQPLNLYFVTINYQYENTIFLLGEVLDLVIILLFKLAEERLLL